MVGKKGAASRDGRRKSGLSKAKYAVMTVLAFSLVVFAVIAALAIINEGAGKFLGTLASVNPLYFAAALLSFFLSDLIGFPKWDMFIRKLGVKISRLKNLQVYMSMFFMDITPGRWGRAVVSYTLNKQTGTKFARTFPAVVADIFTDFLGFVAVVLVSSFLVHKYLGISLVISALLLLPFVFIYTRKPFEYIKRRFGKHKRLSGFFEMGDTYFESHKLLDKGAYAYAMLFTIPSVVLNGVGLYFIILSFGIPLTVYYLPTILFIYTSALLFGMVSGVPGTLGVTDAALIGYLVAFFPGLGITFGIASAIAIFFRIGSTWFLEGVSGLFLVYTLKYWKVKGRSTGKRGA